MIKKLITTALFTLSLVSANALAKVSIDAPAPDFTLQDKNGKQVSLSDFKGKHVVLEWTNHLCPYVKKHYESNNMQALQQKYTEQDVVWLSIISSAPGKQGYVEADEAKALTESRNASPSHVLFDPEGDVGKAYSAKTTPHMYIIDPEGDLVYAGGIDSIKSAYPADIPKAEAFFDLAMAADLKGEKIAKPLTPPYGCSIKYKS